MHGTRWLTALVAVPLLIILVGWGGSFLFFLLMAVVAGLSQWEYHRIMDARMEMADENPLRWSARAAVVFMPAVVFLGGVSGLVPALVLAFLILSLTAIALFGRRPDFLSSFSWESLGLFWIGFPIACLMALRSHEHGVAWVFFTLLLVAAGDTGAYYAGRFFGKHKFAPFVSPKKTLEGFIGGVLLTVLVSIPFKFAFLQDAGIGFVILIALVTALVAPMGDLFESMQKRAAGIKDSGNILPGHGGILDRIDALLFAAPIVLSMRTLFLP